MDITRTLKCPSSIVVVVIVVIIIVVIVIVVVVVVIVVVDVGDHVDDGVGGDHHEADIGDG